MNNYSVGTGVVWRNSTFRTTSDFYAGRSEFRINSKFNNTLVVPESTVLPLADRWDQGPLSVSPSSSGSLFFLSPARFPGFLHRRRLARRASRPYCGSARRACCRCSVHSPRGPVRCRHCSRIRLRTPAIGRRAALVDFAHRTPISSYKTTAVLLLHLRTWPRFSSSFSSITAHRSSRRGSNGGDGAGLVRDPGVWRAGGSAGALCAPVRDDL